MAQKIKRYRCCLGHAMYSGRIRGAGKVKRLAPRDRRRLGVVRRLSRPTRYEV